MLLQDEEAGLETVPTSIDAEDVLRSDLDRVTTAIRLRAVLRRARPEALTACLVWNDLELRQDERRVYAAGHVLNLSFDEFNLLAVLMEEPGRTWTREELRVAVLGARTKTDPKSLNRIVRFVRRQLEPCLSRPAIEAVRGTGYRLV